jgi:hypothetical protein
MRRCRRIYGGRVIPPSQSTRRIQDAKLIDGAENAAADDANKTVYKIALDSAPRKYLRVRLTVLHSLA